MSKQLTGIVALGIAGFIMLTGCGAKSEPAAATQPTAAASEKPSSDIGADPACAEIAAYLKDSETGGAPDPVGLVLGAGELSAKLVEKTESADLKQALEINVELAAKVKKASDAGEDPMEALKADQDQMDKSEALTKKVCGI
ncbi:hypothetical protein [Nonomuraea sediminis]|uniref:hypothetical protein n=1 Tax=Nonomuraea sediminis TaxID=2835864 RepID=UPI001BDD31C4|nr:hypothetical protein [Nonomuraea sediminis]